MIRRLRGIPLFFMFLYLFLTSSEVHAEYTVCISRKIRSASNKCSYQYRHFLSYARRYVSNLNELKVRIRLDATSTFRGDLKSKFSRLVIKARREQCDALFFMACNSSKVFAFLLKPKRIGFTGGLKRRLSRGTIIKETYVFPEGAQWLWSRAFWTKALAYGRRVRRRARLRSRPRRRPQMRFTPRIIGKSCDDHQQCGNHHKYQCLNGKCASLKCTDDSGCATEFFCDTGQQKCIPKAPDDSACNRNRQCRSDRCIGGKCRAEGYVSKLKLGDVCKSTEQCETSLICIERCLKKVGESCKKNDECITNICESSTNLCLALKEGQACKVSIQCSSGLICDTTGHCGRVSNLVTPGGPCDKDADCSGRAKCINKECRLENGEKCKGILDCVSGKCENNVCQPLKKGEKCMLNEQCDKGLKCENKVCSDGKDSSKPSQVAVPRFEGCILGAFTFQADQYRRYAGGVTLCGGVHNFLWNRLGLMIDLDLMGNPSYGPFHLGFSIYGQIDLFKARWFAMDLMFGYKGWFRGLRLQSFKAITSGHFFMIGPRIRVHITKKVFLAFRFYPGFGELELDRYTKSFVVILNANGGVGFKF